VIKVSTPGGLGSGVLLNEDGFAITNAHVIQGETDLRATVWIPQEDGTLKRTTIEDVVIIAVNNHLDLALLLLTHPDEKPFDFSVLEKAETIEVGEPVFAIGNPLGLERSMSQGVISTKQRSFDGLTYIQTDAAINPGNSGGPLFNSRGEVVGITNMGITMAESLNFAIPTRYVKDFIRNREAFAYDEKNPNAGHLYHKPPKRSQNGISPQLKDVAGDSQ
jgi:serine protease Do